MVHQTLAHDVTLVKNAIAQYQLKGPRYLKDFTSLWEILVSITSDDLDGRNVICILDGLDECEKLNRVQVIQYLANFYSRLVRSPGVTKFFLKFLITSRPGVLMEDTFSDLPIIRLKAEDETTAISRDIEFVVKNAVASIARRRNLPLDKQNALIKQIVGNADRTFLWVKLDLQRIQSSERFSNAAIQHLVESVSPDLDGIYNKILSESSKSRHTRKVLQIVVGALRPLSLSELNVAFVIQPTNKLQQDLDLEPDIDKTVKSLCGVFLRVIDSSVYLAHQTAREFLLKSIGRTPIYEVDEGVIGPWKQSFDCKEISKTWAWICRSHLMFTVFGEIPFFMADESTANYSNIYKGVKAYTKEYIDSYHTQRVFGQSTSGPGELRKMIQAWSRFYHCTKQCQTGLRYGIIVTGWHYILGIPYQERQRLLSSLLILDIQRLLRSCYPSARLGLVGLVYYSSRKKTTQSMLRITIKCLASRGQLKMNIWRPCDIY